jgi:glycosyltransferase involved in cell wall biosynthesis
LSDEKGPLQLVDNWPDTDPLDLIGDGPLVGQIETAIRGRANIRLLGKRPRAWLRENLRTYRGVVVPSMCPEGLPTVVLEALAAGRPLLLSKHLQVAAELVQEGAAVTFDPEASETLAYQLSPGGRNPSWNSMGSASLAIYKARFSPHAWLQAIEPIYDSVAAGARD